MIEPVRGDVQMGKKTVLKEPEWFYSELILVPQPCF